MREIERDVRDTADYLNRRELDDRVMAAMASVPRHEFVQPDDRDLAYENRPLPIGYGQTISQPYIVAVMTDLLEPAPGCRALEVGTGSGYQAAVLSQPVRERLHARDRRAARPSRRARGSHASDTRTSRCASATATTAGPRRRRST